MERYRWRMTPFGTVAVVVSDGAAETYPVLAGAEKSKCLAVSARWGALAEVVGQAYAVPRDEILAMIYRESAGEPGVLSADGGVGLMQITSPALKAGLSDDALKDPFRNLTIGVKYMAELRRKYDGDFPKVSAAFNAGSVRESAANPWGMVMTTGHVSAEVAALNTLLFEPLSDGDRANILTLVWQTSDEATDDFAGGSPLPATEETG